MSSSFEKGFHALALAEISKAKKMDMHRMSKF
jgi:hypothetical protein